MNDVVGDDNFLVGFTPAEVVEKEDRKLAFDKLSFG